MRSIAPVRILLILAFFLTCSACGSSDEPEQSATTDTGTTEATDVNYLGGGTAPPDTSPDPEEYRSPVISMPPPPTEISWAPSVDHAIRTAQRDEDKRILVWFRNDECGDCIMMERDVFTDPDVIAATRDWLFVRVNTEQMEEGSEYLLAGSQPPAMVFLDKMGNSYRKYNGTVDSEQFINMLRTWR